MPDARAHHPQPEGRETMRWYGAMVHGTHTKPSPETSRRAKQARTDGCFTELTTTSTGSRRSQSDVPRLRLSSARRCPTGFCCTEQGSRVVKFHSESEDAARFSSLGISAHRVRLTGRLSALRGGLENPRERRPRARTGPLSTTTSGVGIAANGGQTRLPYVECRRLGYKVGGTTRRGRFCHIRSPAVNNAAIAATTMCARVTRPIG